MLVNKKKYTINEFINQKIILVLIINAEMVI